MITYSQATLREFGDGQHLIAYVEVNHPVYKRIRNFKRVAFEVPYYNLKDKGKVIGYDFYFDYKNKYDRRDVRARLEKLLAVKLDKFREPPPVPTFNEVYLVN